MPVRHLHRQLLPLKQTVALEENDDGRLGDGARTEAARGPQEQLQRLAARVRGLRESLRLTQEELSRRAGISVSFASLLERGERSPSYETLVAVARALEVPLMELFREGLELEPEDPSHARLLEFARRSRLTRAQVDRFLAVGYAMFELTPEVRPRAHGQMCRIEGCNRKVLARGLCAPHYHRERRRRV